MDDHYGRSEALFVRKLSDMRSEIADGIDQLVREREGAEVSAEFGATSIPRSG